MATVYLAGKMTDLSFDEMNAWRKLTTDELFKCGFRTLNPVASSLRPRPSNREIRDNNRYQIDNSDVILAELDHKQISVNTLAEIVYAGVKNKPVIVWGTNYALINQPWIFESITAHFEARVEAVDYIIKNYRA